MSRRYEIENPNKNNRRVTTGVVSGPREGVRPRVLLGRCHPVPAEVAVSVSTPTGHTRVLLVWQPHIRSWSKDQLQSRTAQPAVRVNLRLQKAQSYMKGVPPPRNLPARKLSGVGTSHPSPAGLCLHCSKQCRGARGLSVHTRAAHPESYHSERIAAQVKSRWDTEETALMAKEEARLRNLGVKSINQGLVAYMPQRTLEAIKGHRRRPDYKSLVELYAVSTPWRHDGVQEEEMAEVRYLPSHTAGSTPAVESPPRVT